MSEHIFIVDKSDARNVILKRLLEEDGYMVLDFGENTYDFTGTTVYVFSPARAVTLETAAKLRSRSAVFAAKLCENVPEEFLMRRITSYNLSADEVYAHKIALLTAEGALSIVIRETPRSLASSRVLALGYGRVGKAVCKIFSPLTHILPAVTTPAEEALASLYAGGYVRLSELNAALATCDAVINTIPHLVLDAGSLSLLPASALVVDLASSPGGTDFAAAERLGIRAIHALGVPGATAPLSAAEYFKDRILCQLKSTD